MYGGSYYSYMKMLDSFASPFACGLVSPSCNREQNKDCQYKVHSTLGKLVGIERFDLVSNLTPTVHQQIICHISNRIT